MPPEIQLFGSGLGQYGSGSNLGTPPAAAAVLSNSAGKAKVVTSAIAPSALIVRDFIYGTPPGSSKDVARKITVTGTPAFLLRVRLCQKMNLSSREAAGGLNGELMDTPSSTRRNVAEIC